MKYQRLVIFFLLGALLMVASASRADEENKKTVFTFQNTVQVPGKMLPAGTMSSNCNRANPIGTS